MAFKGAQAWVEAVDAVAVAPRGVVMVPRRSRGVLTTCVVSVVQPEDVEDTDVLLIAPCNPKMLRIPTRC
ncbi:hypothetical protein GOP47_0030946 [Adiantum capillus-veneris]|nr:hypothetical protein GOP47_0030946 [Adiantum capillus-veneris]